MRTSLYATAAVMALAGTAVASEGVVNLYSSRHYDTDERLYSDFEDATGIRVNRIEGNADELIARMQAEGRNSPADILMTVDTSRLERAKDSGILQPVEQWGRVEPRPQSADAFHDAAAQQPGARPHVHDPVRGFHGLPIMFDHDQGVADIAQVGQGFQQAQIVPLVQADGGFVQDIEDAGQFGSHLGSQADALRLPAGKRRPLA